MDAKERLADIARRQGEARAKHPDVVAFIDAWKAALGAEGMFGEASFRQRVMVYERAITLDKMVLESQTPLTSKKQESVRSKS